MTRHRTVSGPGAMYSRPPQIFSPHQWLPASSDNVRGQPYVGNGNHDERSCAVYPQQIDPSFNMINCIIGCCGKIIDADPNYVKIVGRCLSAGGRGEVGRDLSWKTHLTVT